MKDHHLSGDICDPFSNSDICDKHKTTHWTIGHNTNHDSSTVLEKQLL